MTIGKEKAIHDGFDPENRWYDHDIDSTPSTPLDGESVIKSES